jgi:hypothetical protein
MMQKASVSHGEKKKFIGRKGLPSVLLDVGYREFMSEDVSFWWKEKKR